MERTGNDMQVAYLKMDHLQDDEAFECRERPEQCLLSVADS